MNPETWRPRLIASIALAYRECWGQRREAGTIELEYEVSEADLRLLAQADLVLPFATVGLLEEEERVATLPSPAELRRQVRERQLETRCMAIGGQLAGVKRIDFAPFEQEMAREWSTWLSYCMEAHSPELRATLEHLPRSVEAMTTYRQRPRRRVERLGPDGERLVSLVPVDSALIPEDAWVEPFLDHCAIVAAHADSFRRLGSVFRGLFDVVAMLRLHRPDEFESAAPFHAFLWPFTLGSLRDVVEIARGIRELAQFLDDDGNEVRMGASLRVRG